MNFARSSRYTWSFSLPPLLIERTNPAVGGLGNEIAIDRFIKERDLLAAAPRFIDAMELQRVGELRADEDAVAIGRPTGESRRTACFDIAAIGRRGSLAESAGRLRFGWRRA